MTRYTAQLIASDEGTTLVEFAMIAPVFMLMVSGAIEFGYMAMARSSLEGSTIEAARVAMTGACPLTRDEDMANRIQQAMDAFSTPDETGPTITVRTYSGGFGSVSKPEPFVDANENGQFDDGESYTDINGNGSWDEDQAIVGSLGGPGDVVSYTVTFRVNTLFPYSAHFAEDGVYTLQATTVVRNEPVFLGTCANVET